MAVDLGIGSAFILAGGIGERLKPLTDSTPKVMLPVNGKPVLEWNIELLRRNGVRRIVLGVGKMAGQIEKHFGNGKKFGIEIAYSREGKPLGTAGALKNAQKLLNKSTFFMMNGDELKDFDLGEMLALHRSRKALATLALVSVQDVSSFGVAEMEGSRIRGFVEKPRQRYFGAAKMRPFWPLARIGGQAPSNLINSGLYILEPEVFDLIPAGKAVSIEREVFPKVAAMGKLFGFEAEGQWLPTDDMQRYGDAKAKWKGFRLNKQSKL